MKIVLGKKDLNFVLFYRVRCFDLVKLIREFILNVMKVIINFIRYFKLK